MYSKKVAFCPLAALAWTNDKRYIQLALLQFDGKIKIVEIFLHRVSMWMINNIALLLAAAAPSALSYHHFAIAECRSGFEKAPRVIKQFLHYENGENITPSAVL